MEKRLKWLRKQGIVEQTPPVPLSGTLKTTVISNIFKEASYDELLDLQKYVQQQLFERGTDVKVVLSTYNNSFENRCIHQVVYVTVIQPVITEYVALRFPEITEAQRANVVEFIAEAMKSPDVMYSSESQLLEKYGMTIDKLALAYDGLKVTLSSVEEPQEDEPAVYKEWRKYLSMGITNPYLITAVEQLRTKDMKLSHLILTTIRVPYGKVMKEHFNPKYGDYVEFADEDEESSSSDEESDDDYGGYYPEH